MKKLDLETLAQFNGSAGNPIYIAYKGKIIDVTGSKMWKGGQHMRRHKAGCDLSEDLQAAPHGEEVFERYPQVAVLNQEAESARPMPPFLLFLLERFPLLERHPHPMTVHFPIVFLLSAAFFALLYLITDHIYFETTSFHCLAGGVLFMPVGMLTGWFTWWLNYLAKPMKAVTIKIVCSFVVLFFAAVALYWRIINPDIMQIAGIERIIYLAIILALAPLISVIGGLGGELTFPVGKKSNPPAA